MKLIFVYNATSGKLNSLLDAGHKILNPTTYSCNLCAITHGAMGERKDWKRFKRTAKVKMIFLHEDEFKQKYGSKWLPKYNFPIILAEGKNGLEVFVASSVIQKMNATKDLIKTIEDRL